MFVPNAVVVVDSTNCILHTCFNSRNSNWPCTARRTTIICSKVTSIILQIVLHVQGTNPVRWHNNSEHIKQEPITRCRLWPCTLKLVGRHVRSTRSAEKGGPVCWAPRRGTTWPGFLPKLWRLPTDSRARVSRGRASKRKGRRKRRIERTES